MAVAYVNTAAATHGTSTTLVSGTLASMTAGNTAIVTLATFRSGSTAPDATAVKLDASTSFTAAKTLEATFGTTHLRVTLWFLPNIASGGSHSATCTIASAPDAATCWLSEVSGTSTSTSTDGTTSGSGTSTSASSGTLTTTNTNGIWWAACCNDTGTNPATFSIGSGWTIPTNGKETNSASFLTGAVAYFANPGSTSGSAVFTIQSSDYVCCAFALNALTPSAGGSIELVKQGIRPAPFRPGLAR